MNADASVAGLRVLGMEHFIAAPYCTQLLADQGADVIKVESGDASRAGYYYTLNRNKRSIVLDLKSTEGRTALDALVRTADVLVTNFAADVPERLGFGYERIAAINPRLVYVHITGFGQNSPYRRTAAFDGVIQAMSGLMDLTGEPDGPPMLAGMFVADHVAGVWATLAVTFGLLRRTQTGLGSYTDLSMLDCLLAFHESTFMDVVQEGKTATRIGSKVRNSFASTYQAKDGYVYIAPLTVRMWQAVAGVVGAPELLEFFSPADPLTDTRLEHRERCDAIIEAWTRQHEVAEIVTLMQSVAVACSPILSIEELIDDPHVKARAMLRTVQDRQAGRAITVPGSPLPSMDSSFAVPPPGVGEHTAQILAELGLGRTGEH
ncbi:MAG TPA: CoA transferase [Streptosporangiaceae bacterium]|jgi:crotonobetainyl-CoA:carnitine CoA-transferase CaiB-like acyl-CoA transferase